MTTPKRLAPVITCHAWNADGTKLAICPNDNTIQIYAKNGNDFKLEHTLTEHDQVVTGIDWAPKSNRIVTCSQDRNAYVWTLTNNAWKPVLVILRINRCATHVKWSPEENKFAVASGAKCVSVCYFEEDNDWWVSKHIKKHKSTVLHVDWHPNNALLATGASDYKVRIFSALIKGVDKKVPQTPFGDKLTFGDPLLEIEVNAWVQSVKWGSSGNILAWVGQDSTVGIANVSSGKAVTTILKHQGLPFRDLSFVGGESKLICVGNDCTPVEFTASPLKFVKIVDTGSAPSTGAPGKSSAFNVFQTAVDKGTNSSEAIATTLTTKHQNCITNIQTTKSGYSTTGLDGNIILW